MTICNRCGGVVSAQAKICPHCGALISEAAGNFGSMMGARKRAEVRERAPLPPTFDPFAAFPASPFPGTTSQPFGAGFPDASAGAGRWQAPASPGFDQLPEWLRPSTSDLSRSAGAPGQSAQPRAGSDPFAQRAQPGVAPTSGPLSGVPPVNPLAPAARPPMGSSPYRSGGRNSTDDLFAASSLLEQNKLPEWLRARQEQSASPGVPTTGSRVPPAPEPRPAPFSGADPFASSSVSEDLPEWLRSMDPGAPPPSMSGRFGTAASRAQLGAAGPLGGTQASPFGAPARDPLGSSRSAPGAFGGSPAFGASPVSGSDPFTGRPSLGQPAEPRPRPFGTTGPQASAPAGLPPVSSPFDAASSFGPSPFGPVSGPSGGGSPASGSPFTRQREPGASPFGPAPAPGASFVGGAGSPGASPFGTERAPGASLFSMPASGSPVDAASVFDAFAPHGAPWGVPPMSAPPMGREPAAPFGEQFAAGPTESGGLPDWLRIKDEESRSARPAASSGSAPLHWPNNAALPDSAPLYRPAERISPFGPAAGAQQASPASAQPFSPASGASQPSPATPLPPSPFEASSLIDEAALPGWLGGTGQTEPLPLPITVAESVTGNKAGERIPPAAAAPAQSQGTSRSADHEEDLPDWLRQVYTEAKIPALEAPAAPSATEGAASSTLSAASAMPQAEVSSVFNASDLLDHHAVPDWLREASETSPLAGGEGPAPTAAAKARPGTQAPGEATLSAQSLLDESSLPDWLRRIEADGPPTPFKSPLPTTGGLSAGPTSGIFSAAELIDTQALPAWLKTDAEKAAASGAAPAAAAPAAPAPAPSVGSSASAPGSRSGVFSAAELVDTQMLPAWLKAAGEESGSASTPTTAPAGAALGSTSGVFSPAELIDTQALPAWLKAEGKRAEGENAASPAEAAGPSGAASGVFSAAELVDTQALPAWIRQEGPAPAMPASDGRSESLSKLSPLPTGFAKQQTGSFSAAELVDTQALPAWLRGAADPSASVPPTTPVQSGPLASPEGERFSAAELIDTQALPVWMKNNEAAGPLSSSGPARPAGQGEPGLSGGGVPTEAAPGAGFSAPELIDPQALPAWLQAGAAQGITEAPTIAPAPQAAQPPTIAPAPQPAQPQPSELPKTGSLSGASLIDRNELPEWLQGQGNFARPDAPSGEGEETPQARVPRRPRLSTEINRAPSQAAASVFSSVLGPVAGEERSQTAGAGRGAPQQPASRAGSGSAAPAQRGQGAPPAGARKAGEPGSRAPGGAAPPVESWESRAPGDSASAEMPPARRMPPASEGLHEWEAPQGRRPAASGQAFGRAGGSPAREQWPESGQQPQWRDLPRQGAPRQYDEAGWEGGPEMPLGYAEDEEVGPPSGVFAKIKRVLGFKR